MLKFLPGLILLQIITLGLYLLAPDNLTGLSWLRLVVPLFFVTVLIALWFGSIALQLRQDALSQLKDQHAKEREKLRVSAERDKHKVTHQAQQHAEKEIRRTSAKANFKVGAAVAGVAGLGGLLLLMQFVTLGVVIMTTAGGTLGGYWLRYKQEKTRITDASAKPKVKTINLPPEQRSEAISKQ